VNKNADDFLNNWYVTRDLMCVKEIDYLMLASLYYIGYGVGIIFFFIPDYFGRKVAMNSTLPIGMAASALCIFSHNLSVMKLGAFIVGLFHLKTTCSFTHAVELVPDKYKTRTIVMVNAYYFSSMVIIGMFYLLCKPDTDLFYTTYFTVATAATVLYIVFVPESPYWLVRNERPGSLRAIKSLNYIAKFNGCPNLISEDTILVIDEGDNEQ